MSRTLRLLLINPRYPESFWSFRWALQKVLLGKRALNPPLGLATLAALCPPHWTIEIVDENVESVPLRPAADLIGLCGMGVQFERQRELLRYYRGQGYPTVAGGSFASLCPERYAELADTVVAGEAEYIWPRFCRDFEAGQAAPLYRETGSVALTDSPTPRFDLLKLSRYTSATLQYSRGCPYLCEFCDIIVMFGRRPRQKSLAQVERELDALRAQGARSVFFVDDNLIGHRSRARELLSFLVDYQRRHGVPFSFGTEVSLNLAQDAELLDLLREAGFAWLFIGVESSDPATLKDTRKGQNLHEDVLTSVRRIQGHGIDVLGGFIVGFDRDTATTFEQQREFIMASGIQAAMVGLLTALPHTPLYERLQREGRLLEDTQSLDNTRPLTNVVPKAMTRAQMVQGYERLYRELLSDAGIAGRVRAKLRHFGRPRYESQYGALQALRYAYRLFTQGLLPGGIHRLWAFMRSLPWRRPALLSCALADWTCGLAMRDYVDRHFGAPSGSDRTRLRRFLRAGSALMRRHRAEHRVALAVEPSGALLSLTLRDNPSVVLIRKLSARLDHLLQRSRTRVVLRLSELSAPQIAALGRMLTRLRRYGDRIAVEMDDGLRSKLAVDSSIFRLALPP